MVGPKKTAGQRRHRVGKVVLAGLIACLAVQGAPALDRIDINVRAEDKDLVRQLRNASLVLMQRAEGRTDPEDLFTAARADYARLLAAAYEAGHYSAKINITLDGREAASFAPLDAPKSIRVIAIDIDPGPRFAFSRNKIAPLVPGTVLPDGFAVGAPARAGLISDAVGAATLAWRNAGHAKVTTGREDVLADHGARALSVDIALSPGPALRFGPVTVKGTARMEPRRVEKISGLTEGEAFSQIELDRAANRLRRSGVFASVTLNEAENYTRAGLLPIEIDVTEMKTRRYSIGGELSSVDGAAISGSWMHRNLRGGAERLKVEGEITNIGSGDSGVDYALGVTIERPATITADTTASLNAKIGRLDELDYNADYAEFGLSFTQYLSEQLTARAGISYEYVQGSDPTGDFRYRNLALPLGVTWDRRDKQTDARKGFYIDAGAKPFLGLGTTGSGARLTLDARGYRSFGAEDRFTFALRLQGGLIAGSELLETPRDDLFYSGGGGTVRGQPYRSLGIQTPSGVPGETFTIGGTEFAAGSVELRARFGKSLGAVAFYDAGHIGAEGISMDHAGAGLGLRYETGFGPIRFDVATPVSGSTGDGVQIYIGLGQSF